MSLQRLEVEHFRNLHSVAIEPGPGLNVVFGPNAAGKTSLLEAIHFLARVRSFRTTRPEQLIAVDADALVIRAQVGDSQHGIARVGISRSRERTQVRINGEEVTSLSVLARYFPVQVINTESQRLLADGPTVRRSFIGWGVFHVEHDYHAVWRRYDRALRQRNAALRLGDLRLARSWEPELAAAGELADRARRWFVEALTAAAAPLLERWLADASITLAYRSGWPQERTLAEAYEQGRARELDVGYTLYGPHRSELVIRSAGVDAQHRLSRGQQKMTAIALLLAQAQLVQAAGAGQAILLIDDLPAELDSERRKEVLEVLVDVGAQAFITCTERDALVLPAGEAKWFHVEQGAYQEVV